jgi:hypothetical protein
MLLENIELHNEEAIEVLTQLQTKVFTKVIIEEALLALKATDFYKVLLKNSQNNITKVETTSSSDFIVDNLLDKGDGFINPSIVDKDAEQINDEALASKKPNVKLNFI